MGAAREQCMTLTLTNRYSTPPPHARNYGSRYLFELFEPYWNSLLTTNSHYWADISCRICLFWSQSYGRNSHDYEYFFKIIQSTRTPRDQHGNPLCFMKWDIFLWRKVQRIGICTPLQYRFLDIQLFARHQF